MRENVRSYALVRGPLVYCLEGVDNPHVSSTAAHLAANGSFADGPGWQALADRYVVNLGRQTGPMHIAFRTQTEYIGQAGCFDWTRANGHRGE